MSYEDKKKRLQELKDQVRGKTNNSSSSSASNYSNSKAQKLESLKQQVRGKQASSVSDRINTWFDNYNNFVNNYNSRYSTRKGTYEDSYVSDSGEWLDTISAQKSNFDKEASAIMSYLDQYGDYFGKEYTDSVKNAFQSALGQQSEILKQASSDKAFWSQFADENEYLGYQREYKKQKRYEGYAEKYAGKTYEELLAATNKLIGDEEREWIDANKYSLIPEADDFAENSNYRSTYRGGEKFNAWSGTYTDSGFDDIAYDYINRNDTAKKRQGLSDLQSKASFLGLDNSERGEMTDDEIATFNYLYATRSPDEAYAYIDYLTSDLNARQRETEAAKWAKYANESPVGASVLSVIESPLKGLSYVGQIADFTADGKIDENAGYNKFSHINSAIRNEVTKKVEEKWGGVGSFAYQTGMSMGDFLFNTAVTGGNSALSLAIMGSGAAADTVIASKDRGLEDWQAFTLGTAAGAIEAVTEKIGIDALFDSAKLGKGALKYILSNTLAEGAEEGLSNIFNLIADTIVTKDKAEWLAAFNAYKNEGMSAFEAFGHAVGDQLILDVLGGAISGGLMGGGGAIIGTIGNTVQGKDYKNTYGADIGSALAGEAVEISPDSKFAQRMQAKAEGGRELSNRQIGKLVQQNETAMRENDVQTIKTGAANRLTELGESGNVDVIASALTKQVTGERLTLSERAAMKNSKFGQRVANELNPENIRGGGYSSAWAEKIGTDRINAAEYGRMIAELEHDDTTPKHLTLSVNPPEEPEEEAGATGSEDVGVKVKEISSVKDGKITVKLDSGEVVDASKVDFGNEDVALVYQAAAEMSQRAGYNEDTVKVLVNGFESSGLNAAEYLHAFRDSFNYGAAGTVSISALEKGKYTSLLSEKQRELAFHLGKAFGEESAQRAEQERARIENEKTASAEKEANAVKTSGEVIFDSSVNQGSLSKAQKAQIKVLQGVSSAVGAKIRLFASEATVTEDGRRTRVFSSADGEAITANGWYDNETGEIWIDVNAGVDGNGLILFTAAHELTHFIKDWSSEKYNAFANFLISQYAENGVSVDELIEAQIEKAAKRGREMTREEAFDEVVADSCESFLTDSNAAEKISALNEKDATLAEKIKSYIHKLLVKIRNLLNGIDPDSEEGKIVRGMTDSLEQLYKLWTDALEDAGRSFQAAGVAIDSSTESVAPQYSERTWTASEYVVERNAAAKRLAESLGVTLKQATKYIDNVNSIAKAIANDRARLDYEASSFGSAFVSNVEYGGGFDFTTLCKKRRIYTGTFSEIQKRIGDNVLTPDDILEIRNMMIEGGIEATCGLCYVEGSRANMGKFAKKFIELYKRDNPDGWTPTMVDVNTPDGVEQMRINHPETYERYEYFWNHYGKLQDSDPALFASQQKPKLYEARKEYKGEILQHFDDVEAIAKKNLNGGIRMQSFSDFEIVHLIDTMQIIMDMANVGLAGQVYTKVPEFAEAFGNTGLKINLSLIAKGVDANGNLIFDDREGMPAETAFKLRDKYSSNVGTILVIFTDEQLKAAMADPRVDFIIPFHRSQWKKSQYGAMGLPKGTKDYTFMQNEKLIKPTYHEYRGRMVKDKASNYMPNEYWDFSKSGKENAEAYLEMCAENNKRPKFYKLLDFDGKGKYSLKKDGSTDGYWKLLIDFKMYDNDGVGSPQKAVTPDFSMNEAMTMLEEYKGGHQSYPIAHGVVDKFVEGYKDRVKFSERDSNASETVKEKVNSKSKKFSERDIVPITEEEYKTLEKHFGITGNFNVAGYLLPDGKLLDFSGKHWGDSMSNSRQVDHRDVQEVLNRGNNGIDDMVDMIGSGSIRLMPETGGINLAVYPNEKQRRVLSVYINYMLAREGQVIVDFDAVGGDTVYSREYDKYSSSSRILGDIRNYFKNGKPSDLMSFHTSYSERDPDAISSREVLANALEGAVQNDIEAEKLAEYKSKIAKFDAEEQKLRQIRAEIKELSFTPGKRDNARLAELRAEAEKTANRINIYDKQLLRLEASKPLEGILQREKQKAYKKAKADAAGKMNDMRAVVVREKIKKIKAEIERELQRPTDRTYIPTPLGRAMIEVCSLIDTDTPLIKKNGTVNRAQEKREKTKERLSELAAEYENLKNNDDYMLVKEHDEQIDAYLKQLRNEFDDVSIKDMSLDQLREFHDILRSIIGTLRDARKVIGKNDAKGLYEYGNAIISEQKKIGEKRGERSNFQKQRDKRLNLSLSPMRNIERMSGYNPDSALVEITRDFEEGVRKKNFWEMGARKSFDSLITGKNEKNYQDSIYKEFGKEYTDSKGRKFRVSKMQMMQAILSYEREISNAGKKHIEKGGLTFADLKLLEQGKIADAVSGENAHNVPNAAYLVVDFISALANDKWAQDYMATAREFFNKTAKDAINDTYLRLKHRIIARDKNYIPYEVDKTQVVRDITNMDSLQQTINSYGILQDTQKNAPQALIITGLNNMVDRHIDQVGSVYGLAIPVRNFNKIWNIRESAIDGGEGKPITVVQGVIEENWGADGKKFIEQMVTDLQGARKNTRSELERKIESGYIGATFALNLSVVMKQIGSLYTANSELDRSRTGVGMLTNLAYTMAHFDKLAAEVDKYTAAVYNRRQGLSDNEVHTFITQAKKSGISRALDKLPAGINPTKWITFMDASVALSLWKYVKADVAKSTKLKGEELLKETAKRFDSLIENTQSMSDVLHKPEIQKRQDAFSKSFAMFKTDLYQSAGQLRVMAGRYQANKSDANKKALTRTVVSIARSAAWNSLMTTLFALLRYKVNPYRDDEEELTPESWLKRQGVMLAGDFAGYLFPIFGSEIVGLIENVIYGESEEAVDSLALTLVNDLVDSITTIGNAITEGEMPDASEWENLLMKSAQFLGIPLSNIKRTVKAIRLHAEDIANGEFLSFEAGANKTDAKQLYDAVISGNDKRIEKAEALFDDQKAIDSALRKGLRENDVRIKAAARMLNSGDIRGFAGSIETISGEGVFDGETVEAAIRAEASAFNSKIKAAAEAKRDGETDDYIKIVKELRESYRGVYTQDEIVEAVNSYTFEDVVEDDVEEFESVYKNSDINAALESGDTDTASEIIKELIEVKAENNFLKAQREAEESGKRFKGKEARTRAELDARSTIRSSLTNYWKKRYIAAYESGNEAEINRISELLYSTGIYGNRKKYLDEVLEGWLEK